MEKKTDEELLRQAEEAVRSSEKFKDEQRDKDANKFTVERERQAVNTFMNAISFVPAERQDMAQNVIDYILTHLSTEGLKGRYNFIQHKLGLKDSVDGLFSLIYLGQYYPDDQDELVINDAMFMAARQLISLLYTRILNGTDVTIILAELESRRPLMMSPATGAR